MMEYHIKKFLLETLAKRDSIDSYDFAEKFKFDHNEVVGVVKSFQTHEDLLCVDTTTKTFWELTDEGKDVMTHGSHEMQLLQQVPPNGIELSKLMKCLPDSKTCSIGFNKAMSAGWLCVDKSQKETLVKIKSKPEKDLVQDHLKLVFNNNIGQVPDQLRNDYKKRKLIHALVVTCFIIKKGPKFTLTPQKEANDLNVDMLTSGSWRELDFKPYNFNALGTLPNSGHLHPLLKMRAEIRQIFLEMGFKEMLTNNYVESSFWNFDALFQPQQHPARDAHDTFFVSEPAECKNFPRDYLEKVKKVHSVGGFGSQGYGYDWKETEASKNLLRTHTTAVSARMLHQLAKEGFRPAKYFSIDRVFRNETLDATHLAEFQQVEGVVADFNLSLGNLIGILSEFFRKLGISGLKFKPAYNPYTEPSMEIFSYHTGLGKMIEVGNSGMFRPEMLRPMGLPEDVNVLAWGLSLERPTMIKYGLNNIRDLVGPKVDLQMVYNNPICRLDKGSSTLLSIIEAMEQRWDNILSDLKELNHEVKSLNDDNEPVKSNTISAAFSCLNNVSTTPNPILPEHRTEVVVFAKHSLPPHSVLFLSKLLTSVCNVSVMTHNHSSIDHNLLPISAVNLNIKNNQQNSKSAAYVLYYIWKKETVNSLVVAPLNHVDITGEVNILRYLCREYEKWPNSLPLYEKRTMNEIILMDSWLDWINLLLMSPSKKLLFDFINDIEKRVQLNKWLVGNAPSIVDIAVWSLAKQEDDLRMSRAIQSWYTNFTQHNWFGNEVTLV